MGIVYMSDERLICELRAKVLLLLALTINTKWYSSSLLFHHIILLTLRQRSNDHDLSYIK